ncbi:hypothetical protein ACO2Q9_19220 [Variovorax sp. VNK109]|jgi:hypothetical protein|uniref:hypothetical protein n=1 Tax=Variovorax sp. VNK109 TaxID=3400919 RepID=UPI003C0A7615
MFTTLFADRSSLQRIAVRAAFSLTLAASGAAAMAQVPEGNLDQNLWLELGVFRPKIDSTIRANSPSGAFGTTIDGENDLGLKDNSTVGSLLLGARLGDRWRLEFEYFKLNRRTTRSLTDTIDFGDASYPVSASLASEFNSTVYRLSGGYSLFRTPDSELGVVAGIHYTDFNFILEGAGTIGGVGTASAREERTENVALPTLGLYSTYAFAPNWMLAGRVDVFSLNHDDKKGTLVNAQLNLLYRITRNMALGVGYRLNDYRLSTTQPDWEGEVKYKFRGPQMLLNVGF